MNRVININKDNLYNYNFSQNCEIEIDDIPYKIKELRTFDRVGVIRLLGINFDQFNNIILINGSSFIGDSISQFWPSVIYFQKKYPSKKIIIYSHNIDLFDFSFSNVTIKPIIDEIKLEVNESLFYNSINTLVISFTYIEEVKLKFFIDNGYTFYSNILNKKTIIYNVKDIHYLKEKTKRINSSGFYNLKIKLNFLDNDDFKYFGIEILRTQLLNMDSYLLEKNNLKNELKDLIIAFAKRNLIDILNQDRWKAILDPPFIIKPDTTLLKKMQGLYENVYEYNAIMLSILLGPNFNFELPKNILKISRPNNEIDLNFLLTRPLKDLSRKMILINLNVGNHKEDLEKLKGGYFSLFCDLSNILISKTDYNIVFTFPEINDEIDINVLQYFNTNDFDGRLSIIKNENKRFWLYFMEMSEKVISYDTGFVHLSYLVNRNVLTFGGESFLWHFTDYEYVLGQYYNENGEFLRDKYEKTIKEIVNWVMK